MRDRWNSKFSTVITTVNVFWEIVEPKSHRNMCRFFFLAHTIFCSISNHLIHITFFVCSSKKCLLNIMPQIMTLLPNYITQLCMFRKQIFTWDLLFVLFEIFINKSTCFWKDEMKFGYLQVSLIMENTSNTLTRKRYSYSKMTCIVRHSHT